MKKVEELIDFFNKDELYTGVPQNIIFAFATGDIAYVLANNFPKRKQEKPYRGCRVLDGTSSEDDWIGFVKAKDLPLIINPKKGFIVTANNRPMPENVISDIGTLTNSITRSRRATEMI
jgi:penicillin amidase